jgi:hypothetical protein
MSLYLPFTKADDSTEMLTAPGAVFTAEGQALVRAASAPAAGVLPGTGVAANDIFAGFALAGTSALPFPESYTNKVEQFLVPVTGVVTLSLTPVAGQVFLHDDTAGTANTAPTVSGKQVTGLTAGNQVTITYKYAVSVVQARALFGDVQPGGYVGAYVGQIGVVTRGSIWTSEFDSSANWAIAGSDASHQIVVGANGQLKLGTVGTNGVAVPGAYVIGVPGQDVPFLGIRFSAA